MKDHFTIHLDSGRDKELLKRRLDSLQIKKIDDRGDRLVIYPKNIDQTMSKLLRIIKEEHLDLRNLGLRNTRLREIFEKIINR